MRLVSSVTIVCDTQSESDQVAQWVADGHAPEDWGNHQIDGLNHQFSIDRAAVIADDIIKEA